MKRKNLLLFALSLLLVFSAFAGCAGNESVKDLSKNTLSYKLISFKEGYAVTGIGGLKRESELVIPDLYEGLPVVKIEKGAFLNNSKLTSVTVGSNVREIADKAFEGCSLLEKVELPSSLEVIVFRLQI